MGLGLALSGGFLPVIVCMHAFRGLRAKPSDRTETVAADTRELCTGDYGVLTIIDSVLPSVHLMLCID